MALQVYLPSAAAMSSATGTPSLHVSRCFHQCGAERARFAGVYNPVMPNVHGVNALLSAFHLIYLAFLQMPISFFKAHPERGRARSG